MAHHTVNLNAADRFGMRQMVRVPLLLRHYTLSKRKNTTPHLVDSETACWAGLMKFSSSAYYTVIGLIYFNIMSSQNCVWKRVTPDRKLDQHGNALTV